MSLIETDIFGVTHDKVQTAMDRIRAFEPPEGYYVATSFGKDSIVIMDLVRLSKVKADYHHNATGIDPPELYRFGRLEFPFVQIHHPKITMWKLIEKKGFPPTRGIRYCCEYLKERGGEGRRVVTGVRWAESARRKNSRKMTEHCLKRTSITYLNPIIDWSDQDVWDYIHGNNLPYCDLYDCGFKRLGCLLCPSSTTTQMKKEADMYPRFKALYIKAFQKAVDNPNRKRPSGQRTGQEMYDWWISGGGKKDDPDQTVMFE
jgi:phosphoadenosine phosphosulfate reductase